jgi:ABC-type antimicrobial peptide transport system permease subunit
MVLGESVLISLFGATFGVLIAAGMLKLMSTQFEGSGFTIGLTPIALVASIIVAIVLGLVTAAAPALGAYRMRIVDALGRR